ncbi:cysteine desulfurase family protein [Leucobacter chromiireducens subsp. chromiireducens]
MSDGVAAAYLAALRTVGNPASTHAHGQDASDRLETARGEIAAALGCDHAELILTGGGTESVNLALKGLYWGRRAAGSGATILVADGEHHATIEAAEWLRDTQGAQLIWLPLDAEGRLHPETLRAALAEAGPSEVALVSFLWANNEVGTVQPVTELCAVAAEVGVPVHVDAIAALGQIPIDFARSGAAAVSVSAHKIGGPVGVGALLVSRRATIEPLFHGGTQQRGRSGTQDVAGAVAFAAALAETLGAGGEPRAATIARLTQLRDELIGGIHEIDPSAVLRGPRPGPERLPGNAHFTFPGCQGDSLVFLLDAAGVSVSVGSACQAGVAEPSHVLRALGASEAEAAGALRFTLAASSEAAEIEQLLAALPDALVRARSAGLA